MTADQEQLARRCRALATQMDEQVIGLRQKGAPVVPPEDAIALLRAIAPLAQATTRYCLAMLDSLTTTPVLSVP